MPNDKRQAIHFGAGNIGRGFIGPILVQSGLHVVFADVDKHLIDALNTEHHYDVHILDQHESQFPVDNVSAVLSTTEDVIREIANTETVVLTTAVGVAVLDKIASTIAKGLEARRESGAKTLNVIACENTIGATTRLHEHVEALLSPEGKDYVKEHVGFADCSVDRIVPPFDPNEHEASNELDVGVEGFYEWIVEGPALAQPVPDIKGWRVVDSLRKYNERKLFTLNTGHAIAAYLGVLKDKKTIDEAIADKEIHDVVYGALHESGDALVKKHEFEPGHHGRYISKIMERYKNPNVKDDVGRVGRQPLRKLGQADRLVGPLKMCKEFGVDVKYLPIGVAAALLYDDNSDEQSRELQGKIKQKGLSQTIVDITGFEQGTGEHRQIEEAYERLKKEHNR